MTSGHLSDRSGDRSITHALTFDIEDWHQLFHRRLTGAESPPTRRVIGGTHAILELLEAYQVKATFFIVGSVAESYPEIVREIVAAGHEIGSHTHGHHLIHRMGRAAFAADIKRSQAQLQDLTGQEVIGFRAPEFSVDSVQHWCFDVMAECGFKYDSSVFPSRTSRYGIADAPQEPFDIATPSGPIREYPLATWDFAWTRVPIAGGSYFRFLPAALLRRGLGDLTTNRRIAVLYFHPYEFYPTVVLPMRRSWRGVRMQSIPFTLSRIVLHNLFTGAIQPRLKALVAAFNFAPLRDAFASDRRSNRGVCSREGNLTSA